MPRFTRRTSLAPNEYRTKFRQIDCDVIDAISSDEAAKITPQMSRIYLRLIQAPIDCWEREGVLRFGGQERDGEWMTAWEQLLEIVGVASATARKAIAWMAQQGIIGYFAGKNGVGIRVFFNRAAASIREKAPAEKNLPVRHTSTSIDRASSVAAPFKEISDQRDILETDIPPAKARAMGESQPSNSAEIVEQVVRLIGPQFTAMAEKEQRLTRQWFVDCALPKAIRVAQRSAYDILQKGTRPRSSGAVSYQWPAVAEPKRLSDGEISVVAEACVALIYAQNKPADRVLAEIACGLIADDLPRVRTRLESILPRPGDI